MARICWGCSTGCLIYSFVIQVISEKHCVAKVLLAIWEISLQKNNRNCNFYRFSYNSLLSSFCIFLKTKTRIKFSVCWWSGKKKYFCFLFIVSRAILQSHAEQKMMFSIKDFFSKCGQIRSFLQIWSHLLKKSLM